jgi:N-acetyl sugar amidotransferase
MSTTRPYQICKKCVLDTTAVYIKFDEEGICDSCRTYERMAAKYIDIAPEIKKRELDFIVNKIKRRGKKHTYDCILGLSGGVDSSYLAFFAKQLGLRPLIVHFDNGWNSEMAVKNIENIVSKMNYDLNTYVINWDEFKELQLAYLKSSVVDTEVPTDYLIFAVLNKLAAKFNIKYILSGYNFSTEFGMPKGWNISNKFDTVNLNNIYKKYGRIKLRNFPKFGLYKRYYYEKLLGIETVALLNLIEYNKKQVKELIKKELGWQDYGGKHHESIFTRFYQDYILPKKFNIDKRRTHWSALICSGQATREEALADLEKQPYSIELQNQDREFVIKKFDLTEQAFENIMQAKPVDHAEFGYEDPNSFSYRFFNFIMRPIALVVRKVNFIRATGKWKIK